MLRYPLGRLLTVLQPFPGSLVTDKQLRSFTYLSVGSWTILLFRARLSAWGLDCVSDELRGGSTSLGGCFTSLEIAVILAEA